MTEQATETHDVEVLVAEPSKLRKVITWSILAAFIVAGGVTGVLWSATKSAPIEDQAQSAVEEMQDTLPKKVDEVTTLTSVKANGATILYTYTIAPQYTAADMDKSVVQDTVISGVCKPEDTRSFLDDGGTVHFTYTFADDTKIEFSVDIGDC